MSWLIDALTLSLTHSLTHSLSTDLGLVSSKKADIMSKYPTALTHSLTDPDLDPNPDLDPDPNPNSVVPV